MDGRGSWWLLTVVLGFTVARGSVEAKFHRSDIESEPWAEFPVNFSPLTSQSVQISKMSWNSSSVFPSRAKQVQGGLYSDQMMGIIGTHSGAVGARYGPFMVEGSLEKSSNGSSVLGYDIMAELATQELVSHHITRIQVLFLLKAKPAGHKSPRSMPCLRATAHFGKSEATAACTPSRQSLSCLAQITIPSSWWRDGVPSSIQTVEILYSVHAPSSCRRGTNNPPLIPSRPLGNVQFQQRQETLTISKEDKNIWLHVPKMGIAIGERFQIAVSIHQNFTAPGCVIRAKARRGLRVIAVHTANQQAWDISFRVKQGGGSTMVTVMKVVATTSTPTEQRREVEDITAFTIEFEVENTTASSRLVSWRIDYEKEQHITTVVTTIPIVSSSGQSIIPIVWAGDIVNTAVLNGQKVSLPMSVVTVTQSGQVHNITGSAECTSLDPDILKVKQDCTAVYVDGTETSGALGKKIRVAFAGREVYREFNVWYPELPLEVVVSDPKLSLIRGWKIPVVKNRSRRDAQPTVNIGAETLGLLGGGKLEPDTGRGPTVKSKCHLRYQQAKVDMYTRFYAPQANTVPRLSSRKRYLYGEDIRHCVTHYTRHQLQAVNDSIVQVEGTRVTGLSMGMTRIQVIGKDGKQILGEATIFVSDNKVEAMELHVGLVSGLAIESVPLTIEGDEERARSLTRVTSRRTLFAQFQEALMDAQLEFDDGAEVALQDIDPSHFQALITTLNPDIVAKSPGSTPHHPAVIALKEGSTTLMLEVALPPECQRRHRNNAVVYEVISANVSFADRPKQWWPSGMDEELLAGKASIDGRIKLTPQPGKVDYGIVHLNYEPEQKRPKHGRGKSEGEIMSIPIDIPFSNDMPADYPSSENMDDSGGDKSDHYSYKEEALSPLEIGMYIVLGIFCLAILAFMINCVLFIARYHRSKKIPKPLAGTYPQNWVLFGTEFDGRTLPHPHCREETIPMRNFLDDSNHGDCSSRGEHTCTESEVSIERHSVENNRQVEASLREGTRDGTNTEVLDDKFHCQHPSCVNLSDTSCCVMAEGQETVPFIPCHCQCECHEDDENVNEDSTTEERDNDSECTDTERTPLNTQTRQPDLSDMPMAGACCDIPSGGSDSPSDTPDSTPSETHSDCELRITINPSEETQSTNSSSKSQGDEELDQASDSPNDQSSMC